MCMQAFRIILYWTLNYYQFASFDHALENHGHLFDFSQDMMDSILYK